MNDELFGWKLRSELRERERVRELAHEKKISWGHLDGEGQMMENSENGFHIPADVSWLKMVP